MYLPYTIFVDGRRQESRIKKRDYELHVEFQCMWWTAYTVLSVVWMQIYFWMQTKQIHLLRESMNNTFCKCFFFFFFFFFTG